jgi:hypothetical protein
LQSRLCFAGASLAKEVATAHTRENVRIRQNIGCLMKAVSHSPALSEVMALLRAAKLEEHAVSTEKMGVGPNALTPPEIK